MDSQDTLDKNPFWEIIHTNAHDSKLKLKLARALSFPEVKVLDDIYSKQHFRYLLNYLFLEPASLDAKTIIIEKNYTSVSYISDYINYYAECYFPYQKQCRRVHFFNEHITEKKFIELIHSEDSKEWEKIYLGNFVIKPIPRGFIGASNIRTYKEKEGRFYTGVIPCNINLFGKKIQIDSLPYQEQDGIVGSCASSALWFAFQKTATLFHTAIPNPGEITKSAGYDSYNTGKSFPNNGLEINQVCKAISSVNLISELRISDDYLYKDQWVKGFIYSYLRMGVPILLGIEIEKRGNHLITLNGYRITERHKKNNKKLRINIASDLIGKVYGHDDQLGPFAKLEFIKNKEFLLRTSWWENIDSNKKLNANIICIVVPLPKTIKVTYENILEEVSIQSVVLKLLIGMNFLWDIFLIESNIYKQSILEQIKLKKQEWTEEYLTLLFTSMPKYIWVAQACIKIKGTSYYLFDIIYDASDVNYENSPYHTCIYDKGFAEAIKNANIHDELIIFKNEKRRKNINWLYTWLDTDHSIITKIDSIVSNSSHEGETENFEKAHKEIMNKYKELEGIYERVNKNISGSIKDFDIDIDNLLPK